MPTPDFIRESTRDDDPRYVIGGTREDGSEYIWHGSDRLADMLAMALNKAEEAECEADAAMARAASFRAAVKRAERFQTEDERLAGYRELVIDRLDWAAHWLVTPSRIRLGLWPSDYADALPLVRAKVEASDSEPALRRWAMICERNRADWAMRIMRATGVIAPEDER